MKNKRFEIVYSQGIIERTDVLVDKETGVNYVYHQIGDSAGLTVLLDKDGKPVITPINLDNDKD